MLKRQILYFLLDNIYFTAIVTSYSADPGFTFKTYDELHILNCTTEYKIVNL